MKSLWLHALLLCFGWAIALSASATTSLFEITKDDRRILLGGTIHLLHPDEFPLPQAFYAAYDEADALYLEADLAAIEDPAFTQQLMQIMLYPPGQTLDSELSPEVWQALTEYSKAHQFPVQQFVGFDPAFVSMVMTVMAAQQNGIEEGVDTYFMSKAAEDGLPMGYLETPKQVLDYMRTLAGQDGDEIIEATLNDLERFDEMMTSMVSAWKQGDMKTLDRDLGGPMREQAPDMYQTILIDRNQAWMPIIEGLFDDDSVELVLVGALHLAGDDSLLSALKQKGYSVEPYTASSSAP